MQDRFSVIDETASSGTPEEQAAIDVFDDRLAAEGSKPCHRTVEVRPFR
jgi:hypothetical protein